MQRALTDFGAEESFGQAAKRFEEHYGWEIDRATVRREVEHTAQKAEQYVEMRLLSARKNYSQPLKTRPVNEQLVVELDGCHIRTGKKITTEGALHNRRRDIEVLQCNVHNATQHTFLRMCAGEVNKDTFVLIANANF